MVFQLHVRPMAAKQLERLPEADQLRVEGAIKALIQNPFSAKKLDGEYAGCYSYRVWPYRIIYRVYKKELLIFVIEIGHRQGVYK